MRRAFAAASLALALAGCASSAVVREPPAPLTEFSPTGEITKLWSEDIGASAADMYLRLSPILDNGVLYASDPRGRVTTFEAASGKKLWETDLDVPVSGGVAVGDDFVVVGTRKGQVVALDRSNGTKVWASTVSSEILAPPAIGSGVVVAQSVDGRVAGLSAADGGRIWTYERTEPPLSLRGTSTPTIVGDNVLLGFASGKIAAVGVRDGRPAWELTVAQPHGRNEIERLVDVDAPLLVAGDALFAVSFQGKLIAVDMKAGRIAWSRELSSFTGMDADRSNLYITDENGDVLAFDLHTGASVWKQDKLHGRHLSAPVYADGYVVVGDFEGYLHWLSRDDGHFVARYQVGSHAIRAQPIADGNVVFAANEDGTLAALRFDKK